MSVSNHNKIAFLSIRLNVSMYHYSLILCEPKNKDIRESAGRRWQKNLQDIRQAREKFERENEDKRILDILDRYQEKRYTFYTFK